MIYIKKSVSTLGGKAMLVVGLRAGKGPANQIRLRLAVPRTLPWLAPPDSRAALTSA